jgi:hypothetical protein
MVLVSMIDQVIIAVTLTGNAFPVRSLGERRLKSSCFILHGMLVGVVAMLLYVGFALARTEPFAYISWLTV